MANPFSDFGISDEEVERAIRESAAVDVELRKFAEEVVEVWRANSPIRSGEYAASVKVLKVRHGKAVVGTRFWKAHMIEYGTGPDTKTGSRFGPNTPTPEFAPGAKTAAHFGGTLDADGIEADLS